MPLPAPHPAALSRPHSSVVLSQLEVQPLIVFPDLGDLVTLERSLTSLRSTFCPSLLTLIHFHPSILNSCTGLMNHLGGLQNTSCIRFTLSLRNLSYVATEVTPLRSRCVLLFCVTSQINEGINHK